MNGIKLNNGAEKSDGNREGKIEWNTFAKFIIWKSYGNRMGKS